MSKKQKNVPKLRFPGFSEEWELRKLGDVTISFEYGLNAAAKAYDGQNKYIRITDINDESHEFMQDEITSPDTDLLQAENYRLKEGDILFARTGASVGKSYLYKATDGLVYFAGFLIRARIKKEYNSSFVFQNTLTQKYKNYIAVTSQRSGQPGVNAQEYSQYTLMVPNRREQDKLSELFQSLDSLISLQQRKLDQIKEYKKGMLQKLFPKEGASVPEVRFPGFTGEWEQKKLCQIVAEISTGKSVNSEDAAVDVDSIGVMKTSCVSYDSFDASECKKVIPEECNLVKCPVEADTIIVSRMNTPDRVGACGYVSRDWPNLYLPDRLWKLKMNEAIDTHLIYIILTSDNTKAALKGMASGTSGSMHNIPKDAFLEMSILLPSSIKEQQRISCVFKNMNTLITLHQRKLDAMKEYKKGLLQQMFV